MRILAVDYGERHVGLAISDETKTIAQMLPPIVVENQKQLIQELKMIIAEKSVEKVIVGLPLGLSGQDTPQTKKTREFISAAATFVPVEPIDERLTTREAVQKLHEKGLNKRRVKNEVDSMSAYILLENYLARLE